MSKLPKWVIQKRRPSLPDGGSTFAGLFCGCGGLDLGAQLAGFSACYSADDDSIAVDTYRRNVDSKVESLDLSVSAIPKSVNGIDLLLGGPPCQGFSSAGPRI